MSIDDLLSVYQSIFLFFRRSNVLTFFPSFCPLIYPYLSSFRWMIVTGVSGFSYAVVWPLETLKNMAQVGRGLSFTEE